MRKKNTENRHPRPKRYECPGPKRPALLERNEDAGDAGDAGDAVTAKLLRKS